MSNEFIPRSIGNQNCDKVPEGIPHPDFDYIRRSTTGDDEYPEEACPRYLQVNGKFDNLQVTSNVAAGGEVTSNGGSHILSNKKNLPFDMPHPTKEGWRLRHVCLEGPEIGVYLHGKGKGKIIELPDYWRGLVKQETISVNLTPIGNPYVIYVEKIEDNKVYIESNWQTSGVDIEYYYIIHASRFDDDLIVEYEGKTHEDYPNGNEGYSFNFEHNYVKNLIQEMVREYLENPLDKDAET